MEHVITLLSRDENQISANVVAVLDSHGNDDLAFRQDLIERGNVDVDGGGTLGVGEGGRRASIIFAIMRSTKPFGM